MVSFAIRPTKMEGGMNRQVDQRTVSYKIHIEVQVGCSQSVSRRYSGRDPILPFCLSSPYLPPSCCSDTSSRPPLGATSARLCATDSIQRSSLIVALSSRVAIRSPRVVDSYCFSLSRPYPSLPRTCRVLPFLYFS
jgi:hypothetical protein